MAFPQKNPTYGAGRFYFDPFALGTKNPTGQRYLGNTPEFTMNSESTNLDHFNSDDGFRAKDDSVLIELNRTFAFVTDQISPENLGLFFLGDASVVTQAVVASAPYNIASAKKGRRYQIGASALAPAGARGITVSTVTSSPIGTTYVQGTDYVVDLANGGIVFLDSGSLIDDSPIIVNYAVEASSYNRVVTADNAEIYGAGFFESRNPKGEKFDIFMPYVQLRPDGDFTLKSDTWQQLSFSGEILKLDDQTPALYINGRPGSGV